MRLHRFYVKQPLGEEIVVDDVSTIKQWTRVFRYKTGDLVILFDGHFKDCTYEITSVSAKEVRLHLISLKEIPPQDKTLTIYASVIKKDNFELVVQKCTELGVSRIVPILAEHSEKKNINIERLGIIAKEAAEQCGRGDVPVVEEVVTLSDAYLQRDTYVTHIIATMDGASSTSSIGKELLSNKNLALWVGPEGGWGDKDLKVLGGDKVVKLSFGTTVMRAETAAIVISGIFLLQ